MKPDKQLEKMVQWGAWNRPDIYLYRIPDPMKMIRAKRKGGEKTSVSLAVPVAQQLDVDGVPCGNPADFGGTYLCRDTSWGFTPVPLLVECKYVSKFGPKENPWNLLSSDQRAAMRTWEDMGGVYVLVLQVASKFYAIEGNSLDYHHIPACEVQPKSKDVLNWLGPRKGLPSLPETWRDR